MVVMNETLKNDLKLIGHKIELLTNERTDIINKAQTDCKHEMVFEYRSPEGLITYSHTYYVCNNCGLAEQKGHTQKHYEFKSYPEIRQTMFDDLRVGGIYHDYSKDA